MRLNNEGVIIFGEPAVNGGTAIGHSTRSDDYGIAIGYGANAERKSIAIGLHTKAEQGRIVIGNWDATDAGERIEALEKIVKEQGETINKLVELVNELYYFPGMPGAIEAENLFKEDIKKLK